MIYLNAVDLPAFFKISNAQIQASHTHVSVSGGKKCSSFGKFAVFYLLVTPVLRFALLP